MMRNGLYVYKEEGISQENLYMKKQLVNSVKDLCYLRGVTSPDETFRKLLKCLIDTCLVMDIRFG